MKATFRAILFITVIITSIFIFSSINSEAADRAGCIVYIYVSNNSMYVCDIIVDGFPKGNLLIGKNKTYEVELNGDVAKRIKVKVSYDNPDYIDPRSYFLISKTKLECGMSDTMYIAHTK